ncbi:hypothetical protein [Gracilimonas sp.]|uniref:hypothetical protein n=1 Tax=Gracilimonas sp. TaxID=1974203 RepID=UPI003D12E61B
MNKTRTIIIALPFLLLGSLSLHAQSKCHDELINCHIIEIQYNKNLQVPVFNSNHFKHLPADTPLYLKLTSDAFSTFKVELDTVVVREFNPLADLVPFTGPEKMGPPIREVRDSGAFFYLGMFEAGNQATFNLHRKAPDNSWDPLGSFAIQIPKKYRFRVRTGFSATYYKTQDVNIQSRTANIGDIENLSNNDLKLGFRQSQFLADTTTIYRIQGISSKDWGFAPTMMLSFYPFAKKDLTDNTSFFGIMSNENSFKDFLSHSLSLHVGTSLNKDVFSDFYGGINIEVIEGVDLGLSYLSHNVKKIDTPYDYRDEELDGSIPYFTNSDAPKSSNFLTEKRVFDISYSISVDAVVFQKAFVSIFSTLKKGITGG